MFSLFSDKTTIILRKMLNNPKNKWVICDFTKNSDVEFGVGQGRVARILLELERLGYVLREKRGAKSGAILVNVENLIANWVLNYCFSYNKLLPLYTEDNNKLNKLNKYLCDKKIKHAFTLHTGANFYTNYVKTDNVYVYLDVEDLIEDTLDLRQSLNLKQLVSGGNVYLIKPYYKKSIFFDMQKKKKYSVVSFLQLYLDLYNYVQRGQDHAIYLKEKLQREGKWFE